jgi:hypothetical protein
VSGPARRRDPRSGEGAERRLHAHAASGPTERLLRLERAALVLGVEARTLRLALKAGQLPHRISAGGQVLIEVEVARLALERRAAAGAGAAPPQAEPERP